MQNQYDLIIVGAGPAGIFTALELLRKSSHPQDLKILLIEKGKPVERRHCPKAEVGHCINCKPTCAITTGFSGAGAFSDGKLSLSREVGGELPELIGEDFAQELIDYTDKIYLEFGATPMWRACMKALRSRRSASAPSRQVCSWWTAPSVTWAPRKPSSCT